MNQASDPSGRAVWLRLVSALIALGTGVAALVVAIELVRGALG